jgi:hypothetical protein
MTVNSWPNQSINTDAGDKAADAAQLNTLG